MVIFNSNRISKKIADARKAKNMTQMELADRLGVSYQAVSNWERSQSMPDIDKYASLAEVLDISINDLLGSDEGEETIKQIQDPDEPVNIETVIDAAPVMKPQQVEDKVEHKQISLSQLREIAPYVSDDTLSEMMHTLQDSPDFLQELPKLAPFLDEDDLEEFVEHKVLPLMPDALPTLIKLAPFRDEDANGETLSQLWGDTRVSQRDLKELLPFIDSDALYDTLMSNRITDFDSLVELAPFLDDDQVNDLFEKVARKYPEQRKILRSLAPFTESDTIAEYLKSALPKITDEKERASEFHAFLPFLEDDDLLSIFDR